VRRDHHDDFGGVSTWRVAPVYRIEPTGTRLRASYGTGFKAPSLSALFEDFPPFFFANPNLKPERSRGWDAGIEQGWLEDRLRLELSYFHNDIRDLIAVDPVTFSTLVNLNEAHTRGYEADLRYALLPTLRLGVNYTRTRAVDAGSGQPLLRRPRHKASLSADWQFLPDWNLDLAARHVGSRSDVNADFVPVKAHAYTVCDLALAHEITRQWTVQGRLENLFDRNYQEISGYASPGRAWYAALKFAY
jgi:vitamin B12 transporter